MIAGALVASLWYGLGLGGNGLASLQAATFASFLNQKLTDGPTVCELAGPRFIDDQAEDEQAAVLREIAGSARAIDEFLRDSVTAPHILRIHDVAGETTVFRVSDLYFCLPVAFEKLATDQLNLGLRKRAFEAGNIRVEAEAADLAAPESANPRRVRLACRILDRIQVDSTVVVQSDRTPQSIRVWAQPEPGPNPQTPSSTWRSIVRHGQKETISESHPFGGSFGYAKLTKLRAHPDRVVVEAHFAFAEPKAWFDGAPILRSKLSLIAQDEIRRLRRELKANPPPNSDAAR
jgi:hypothetical protein